MGGAHAGDALVSLRRTDLTAADMAEWERWFEEGLLHIRRTNPAAPNHENDANMCNFLVAIDFVSFRKFGWFATNKIVHVIVPLSKIRKP